MKQFWSKLLATGGVAMALTLATAIPDSSAQGQTRDKFFCSNRYGQYMTKVRTPRGNVPLLIYTEDFGPRWNPYSRCQQISKRFQRHHLNGTLGQLSTGTVNNHPVICVTQDGNCYSSNVLITLQRSKNANEMLQKLIDSRNSASGGGIYITPQVFSYDDAGNLSVDLNKLIELLPVEQVEQTEGEGVIW